MWYEQPAGPTGGLENFAGNLLPILIILGVSLFLWYVVAPIVGNLFFKDDE